MLHQMRTYHLVNRAPKGIIPWPKGCGYGHGTLYAWVEEIFPRIEEARGLWRRGLQPFAFRRLGRWVVRNRPTYIRNLPGPSYPRHLTNNHLLLSRLTIWTIDHAFLYT